MSRRVYIYCTKGCDKVVEKYGCEHQVRASGRNAAPLAIVYLGPNGEVSVPARASDRLPKRLEKLGYRIQTISNAQDYSKFCRNMDSAATEKYERLQEAKAEAFNEQVKQERSELRRSMTTQFGKDYLEFVIREGEKQYGERYDAGSHIEGFEYDGKYGNE